MGRDHRKLIVFSIADRLVTEVYRVSRGFPGSERFGLQLQLRKAAVSAAGNIVKDVRAAPRKSM
jgi:four helix bundle protein